MKTNLSYFQHPTSLFFDRKIQRLIKTYKGDGFMLYIYLKSEIFRVSGYYLKYDEFLPEDLNFWFSFLDKQFISEVILFTAETGLFDKEIFLKYQVLTSKEIQEDFIEIMTRMKRKVDPFEPEIDLLNNTNSRRNNSDSSGNIPKDSAILPESPSNLNNLSIIPPEKSGVSPNNSENMGESSEGETISEEFSLERKAILETKINDKNLSFSLYRDRIFEIFFIEKNYPEEELKKFLNHYEKSGWLDKNGNKVVDPFAAARNWKQMDTPVKYHISTTLHEKWKMVWTSYENQLGFEKARHLLNVKPKMNSNNIYFNCSEEVRDLCEENIDFLKKALRSVFGNAIILEYILTNQIPVKRISDIQVRS